ncbi:uncharacterized protein BDZ83DRAFT_623254 [Colletotrichum acutatum]|uniref:Uncharacterized protein n=1 Tax=Glomerella acutata TaxID=27357 RepID=A0AAD8UK89_GLOAC|nr:uncharacterized protein BDZ83DRAFT_623254 [Colletotrichum acutatum]KAK1724312.1 hypothetical protein BDZ83DRAFT_623254 [Colletotrichum acutatum]
MLPLSLFADNRLSSLPTRGSTRRNRTSYGQHHRPRFTLQLFVNRTTTLSLALVWPIAYLPFGPMAYVARSSLSVVMCLSIPVWDGT